MQARIFCPKHGRLSLDDVAIKKGVPVCRKCLSVLEFGKIRPRGIEKGEKKEQPKRKRKKDKS